MLTIRLGLTVKSGPVVEAFETQLPVLSQISKLGNDGAIVTLQLGDATVAPELSVTVPVKEYGPALVGVPVMPPKEFKAKPGGSEPVAML